MLCITRTWLTSKAVRWLSFSPRIYANHYDVLGITPKATQSDIKSAYYNLSKVYHPDRSKSEENAKKFRAISEAYEVLGNIKLKKMYDKGLLVGRENISPMDYQPEAEPLDPSLKFYRSRTQRHVAPTMDGRTPVYDFETWTKHHYGDLLKKAQRDKEIVRHKHEKRDAYSDSDKDAIIYVLVGIVGLFIFLVANGISDYDRDGVRIKKQQSNDDK